MNKPAPKTNADQYAVMAAEFSRDALLVTDADDVVLWLNKGFEELTGFTINDLIGRKPGDDCFSRA